MKKHGTLTSMLLVCLITSKPKKLQISLFVFSRRNEVIKIGMIVVKYDSIVIYG